MQKPGETGKKKTILFLSSYPPRKCGIAAFTRDLARTIENHPDSDVRTRIIALNDGGNMYDYPEEVLLQINEEDRKTYRNIAGIINEMDNVKAVSIQHEFKLYGSDYGENLMEFIKNTEKPIITTFHTILPHPSGERRSVVREISEKSKSVVVMTEKGKEILQDHYGIDPSKVRTIPHGVHEISPEKEEEKRKLGYGDNIILSSFGFMRTGRGVRSSGKGYEYVLDALPAITEKFPNVKYLIIGITHPKYLKTEGEAYRYFLEGMVRGLGVENHVEFINEYLSLEELLSYLKATDVYLCPPLNPYQVTSGTLCYAMGCGCPVVSTPFSHAKEILTPGRGVVIEDFRKPGLISDAVNGILSDPESKERMGRKAYEFTRRMVWPKAAESYLNLFREAWE